MYLPQQAQYGVMRIIKKQVTYKDVCVTPVFYNTNNSNDLFFRFDYHSIKAEEDAIDRALLDTHYCGVFLFNDRSYWWRIEEKDTESISEFLNQSGAILTCFETLGITIKDKSLYYDRCNDLSRTFSELRKKDREEKVVVKEIIRNQEKIVGISRNDIISIYEMAAQCCSAYNNLIMLIDKKNASKYFSYAKGTLKQSQYTRDVAEAKFWTDRIKAFTKPMADFCEELGELYEQTKKVKGGYYNDVERPYGYAADFPLCTMAVQLMQSLVRYSRLNIIKQGEDKEYIEHLKYMADKQRIY